MEHNGIQYGGLQIVERNGKKQLKPSARKRFYRLIKPVRESIPALFDRMDGQYDRVAAEVGTSAMDVLAQTLLDTRRKVRLVSSAYGVSEIRRSA